MDKCNVRSLRSLGWPIPKTALTATIIARQGTEAEAFARFWTTKLRSSWDAAATAAILIIIISMYASYTLGKGRAQKETMYVTEEEQEGTT